MYCRGSTGHIVGIAVFVTMWYAAVCRVDITTATQLLINTTRFPLPRDIGTPRHWNPELKHRDIGTSGHWNPECTGRGTGTDPRTGNGHRPEERFSFVQALPLQSPAVSPLRVSLPSRSRRLRRPGWCTLVAGTVFGLLFPETLRRGAVPQHQSELMGRELFHE